MKSPRILSILLPSILLSSFSFACDICSVYTPPIDLTPDHPHIWHVSVAEQYTHQGTLQVDGHEISNPLGQHLNSSVTQIVFGGAFLDQRLGVQLSLPLIYRSYSRAAHFSTEHGHESGIGDMTLLASYVLWRTGDVHAETVAASGKHAKAVTTIASDAKFSGALTLLAGLKTPTGNSDRIAEEFHEHEHEGFASSAIHGHDLALGSGSWDGVFGVEGFIRCGELFFGAEVQYALRGEGDFDYRYGNDLVWDVGPGVFLLRNPNSSVALQAVVSGEHKGLDTFQGEYAEDTGITFWYVGPRLTAIFGNWSADVGADFPVSLKNTSLQAVPDYRIRASISYRF